MSDTPRTDAEECDAFIGIHSYFDADDVYRGYGFARRLERELTAAQAEALKLQEENAKLQERVRRLEEALDTLTLVVGLTPIAGNKEALQEAVDIARGELKAKDTQ